MKKLLALVVALVAATALTLAASPPAQALGWSGQRCDSRGGATQDGWQVCTQFHSVALANGKIWIDAIQVCFYMVHTNVRIVGSFQNGWSATGGAWGGLPNVAKGACGYRYPTQAAGAVGAGACYSAGGRIDRSGYPDTTWGTSGRVQGGAC